MYLCELYMKRTIFIIIRKSIILVTMVIFTLLLVSVIFTVHAAKYFEEDGKTYIIVIDPGHGGVDGGTYIGNLYEKDINLDIAKKTKAYLEQKGHIVIMTRDKDISLDSLCSADIGRHRKDLSARADIINHSGASIFISIHINSNFGNPATNGSVVFFHNKSSSGKVLAYDVQRALNNVLADGIKRSIHNPVPADYFLLRNTSIPGLIVEAAFISNRKERELLTNQKFKDDLAFAIGEGIIKYFNKSNFVLQVTGHYINLADYVDSLFGR